MQVLEETNLAEELDQKELDEIANLVIEEYTQDLESRSEWEEMNEEWLRLFYQKDLPDEPPWDGSSEEGIPIFAEAVNQFQSRSYKAFFPNRFFIDALPVGKQNKEARERGERIAAHMNFQLGVLDRSYKPNKNQMFMAVALHGSDFTKTYFSQLRRRTVIERVRAMDLVAPYHIGPVRIDELERKTQIKYVSINETKVLERNGYYITSAVPANLDSETGQMQQAIDENLGMMQTNIYGDAGKYALILEQHRLLDLDGDGIAEPYIVWVDKTAKKVLRIQIRYEVDETGAPIADKEPIEYFTHYQFMPNPDGFYGLGLGHLLGKLNRAINKLTRMLVDAGQLSTVGNLTYLISEALGLPGDEFELSMGRGIKIPRAVDDLRKGFMKLEFDGPNPVIGQMIEQLVSSAQRISSSSDILAGQPDKVYQPTALLSMLEQGLQLYSSVQEFIGHSMEDELSKVYRLNARHMVSEEYFFEGDTQITVTQQDYQDDFRIVPIFDPKYSTRSQKMAKAQALREFVLTDPVASQNQTSIWLAGKAYLESLDVENIEEMYPEPPPLPEVARVDDQNLENAYFLMPPEKRPLFDVFPDQDHIRHIQIIDKFIAFIDGASPLDVPNVPGGDPGISRLIATMSNEQKQEIVANLLRHRSLHIAFMYGQMNGVMDEQGNPIGAGQGRGTGMEGGLQDNPDLAEIIGNLQAVTNAPIM